MQDDAPPWLLQPVLDGSGMMVADVVEEDVDAAHRLIRTSGVPGSISILQVISEELNKCGPGLPGVVDFVGMTRDKRHH